MGFIYIGNLFEIELSLKAPLFFLLITSMAMDNNNSKQKMQNEMKNTVPHGHNIQLH